MITESHYYKHFIYKICFPDGAFYIGCTYRLAHRLYQHEMTAIRHEYNHGLYKKMKDYGISDYTLQILAILPNRNIAREIEKTLIESLVNNPNILNRSSPTISEYLVLKSHKERGNNYNKRRLKFLKNKIGSIK